MTNYCYLCSNQILPYISIDYVSSPVTGERKMIHQNCKEKAMEKSPLPGYKFTCENKYGLPNCKFEAT